MKLNAIILIGCMVLSYGCSRNLDKQLFVDLCESKVRIPTEMQVIKDGSLQNMSVEDLSNSVKLVLYYSSAECTSCVAGHFYELEWAFELYPKNKFFKPIVIMNPSENNYNDVVKLLRARPSIYPVYIDKINAFQSLNPHIPNDTRFHTLLLDKYDNVILIGDPISSDTMWTLFKATLDNMLAHDGIFVPDEKN